MDKCSVTQCPKCLLIVDWTTEARNPVCLTNIRSTLTLFRDKEMQLMLLQLALSCW